MTIRDWHDARVLVTGARGFIAARLCRRLIAAGASVHAVSSRTVGGGVSDLDWSRVDLADLEATRRILNRVAPDVLFHLAGHVTGSQELASVEPTLAVNLIGTVHVLTAATESGASRRVVLTGSMQEPDPGDGSVVLCSPYAASKWACSGYARLFHDLYQLPVVTARPMMVYGPGQWDVQKLLPYVTLSLLNDESPAVTSGARELDWVFVDDVVEGLMAIATSSQVEGRTIDLGSGALTSIREITERVAVLVGSDVPVRFGALPDRPLERPRAARVDETRQLTGWAATTSLQDGLRRTVSWYRETCCSPKLV